MSDELLELLTDASIPPAERLAIAAQLRRAEMLLEQREVTRETVLNDLRIARDDALDVGDVWLCRMIDSVLALASLGAMPTPDYDPSRN